MAYNAADMFEHTVDAIPDRIAIVCGDDRRTYAELEARSNALAHYLAERGLEPGDHVGIYGLNSIQWIESLLAVLKVRAVPVNINYRYVEEELSYLFDNADLKGLVYSEEFGPRVAAVVDQLPLLKTLVVINDEQRCRPAPARSSGLRGRDRIAARPNATSRNDRATTRSSSTPAAPPACRRV